MYFVNQAVQQKCQGGPENMFSIGITVTEDMEPIHVYNRLRESVFTKLAQIQNVALVEDFQVKVKSLVWITFKNKGNEMWAKTHLGVHQRLE